MWRRWSFVCVRWAGSRRRLACTELAAPRSVAIAAMSQRTEQVQKAESSRHDGRRSRGACRAVLGAAQALIKERTISTCGQDFGSSHMF